jgi:hypothetical protein
MSAYIPALAQQLVSLNTPCGEGRCKIITRKAKNRQSRSVRLDAAYSSDLERAFQMMVNSHVMWAAGVDVLR